MRDKGIDTLRGLGALGVILCHWACIFARNLYFPSGGVYTVWTGTPLNVITNGDCAVQFFFLISGYLITKKTQSDSYLWTEKYVWKRIASILKIVIPGILLSFVLMKCGLMFHSAAMDINPDLKFVVNYNNFEPTWKSLVSDLYHTLKTGSRYNGPLWTIHTEFFGSILIIFLSSFLKRLRGSYNKMLSVILCMIVVAFVNYQTISMLLGTLLYVILDATKSPITPLERKLKRLLFDKRCKFAVLIVAFYFATINCSSASGIYIPLKPFFRLAPLMRAFGLFLLMFYFLQREHRGVKVISHLGKLSSYIYIFHWPILLSLGCFMYISLYKSVNYYLLISLILVSVVLATVVLSVIYDRIINLKIIKRYAKAR